MRIEGRMDPAQERQTDLALRGAKKAKKTRGLQGSNLSHTLVFFATQNLWFLSYDNLIVR